MKRRRRGNPVIARKGAGVKRRRRGNTVITGCRVAIPQPVKTIPDTWHAFQKFIPARIE